MAKSVDPDQVLISINEKLRPLQPLPSGCCIYRVPENLRKLNEDAYRPWIVSIGPFHHNDPELKPMQDHKPRYLQSFLEGAENKNIGDYVQLVSDKQEDIRNCYSQQIEVDDDMFVEMVLLDAAFVIEFLRRRLSFAPTEMDFKGNNRYLMYLVFRDMILEENQLPFFVLNDIYNLAYPGTIEKGVPFFHLANMFAGFLNNFKQHIQDVATNPEIKHFVDLLRLSCLPLTCQTKPNHRKDDHKMTNNILTPSVTELHEAGLKFKESKSESSLDISYNNGVLLIPKLYLADETETVFRNFMVFEQLHPSLNYYISGYIIFLDSLINTTKDVDILVQNGIIHNCLGSNEEAAKLINSLCTHILVCRSNFYYSGVCDSLNKYMSRKWHTWGAILKHKYFTHPWAATSVIYAIVLLILTILQVITGFYQIKCK